MAAKWNPNDVVSLQELLVSALATADVVAKLLIEKGVIAEKEFMETLQQERVRYHRILNPTKH